ncbi:hypothetical protein C6380_00115 [Pseudomonas syringae pv. actinidiae]|uniref:hypothetical protein n=1 Tax=Pseudomonas syringae TaxID=317 RepID=UPI000BB53B54|nr:hypothetical protein [Pseudomonas syringae]PBK47588.1 hypothetical protein BUE60_28930 [Pseudomonas syringae pv. actinidiae]PBK52476.1 hypothetical protein BUE61_14400 [Pseudomonas syringae pv. actinidiae]RJX44704.1 hypothetical protein C6379_29400 [Pseudomonas syringae pv. actinidiae]RJX55818.1 hypothetical protein C6383_23545 [Pseudomonas syringae pv. actinidiae]RJX62772.1 hypothetical protein C6380_00115 [Pseudomonas syringae pv. actinidiae]
MRTIDYRRFEYEGDYASGACFVRVGITDEGTLFGLIARLRDHDGTSVTNDIEEIISGVIYRLHAERALPKAFFSMYEILEQFAWVEHYAPGIGISSEGSWAIVTLDASNTPDWEYMSLDDVVAHTGVNLDFFTLGEDDLRLKK